MSANRHTHKGNTQTGVHANSRSPSAQECLTHTYLDVHIQDTESSACRLSHLRAVARAHLSPPIPRHRAAP
eukprot:19948-Eustigmatos_ZCMA.PRE.1